MFQLTPENHVDLAKLNSSYSLRHRGTKTIGDIICLLTVGGRLMARYLCQISKILKPVLVDSSISNTHSGRA